MGIYWTGPPRVPEWAKAATLGVMVMIGLILGMAL